MPSSPPDLPSEAQRDHPPHPSPPATSRYPLFLILAFILVPLSFLPYWQNPEFTTIKIWFLEILAILGIYFWIQSYPRLTLRRYLPLILFFLFSSLSLLSAPNPYLSLFRLGFLAAGLAYYLLGLNLNPSRSPPILKWAIFSAVIASLLGILQSGGIILSPRPDIYGEMMYPSTFRHTNYAAQYLSPLIPITLGIFLGPLPRFRRILLGLALAIQLVFLILTRSRAGILSGFLGSLTLLFFWLFIQIRTERFKFRPQIISLAAIIILIPALLATVSHFSPRVRNNFAHLRTVLQPEYPANRARLLLYRDSTRIIAAHPMVGIGLGNFTLELPRYWSDDLRNQIISGASRSAENAHNDYLTIAAETGLPAFLIFLFLILSAFRLTWKQNLRRPDFTRLTIMAGLITILLHSLVDYPLQNPSSALLFWFLLGISSYQPPPPPPSSEPELHPILSSRLFRAGFTFFAILLIFLAQ